MKRFIAVLSGLLVLPAFADTVRDTVQPIAQPSSVASRSGATGRGAARVVPSVRGSANTSARNVNARTSATSRNATQARTGVKSREVTTTSPRATATNNARVAQRTGTSARTATNISPVATNVRRNTTTNTGRVVTTNARAGVRSGVTARAGTVSANTNATDNTTTISQMDNLTQMTDYCKAQYTSCMDNYCNVLDDNQGRCTCSKNIKNYEKTEKALKEANEALQDVAQQIQYIGLTADEIETLFSQTEAEIQMQATTDNSQLKNSLDSIRDLIVDVKSGTATTTDTGMSFDLSGLLDFNIGDASFDLSAIFGSNNTNTNSISNQRGEQLYKTASARCKASVLNTCQNQGVDISVITNAYDMEIDKQCIAYERSLNEANDNMNNTVRNAKTVLQKARLMVSQQKNAYDLRGCVNALDSCMQDEFVCGSDYENCLDPTGKYIVNGEIVAGSMPGLAVAGSSIDAPLSDLTQSGLYKTWNYDNGGTEVNAWNQDGSLAEYINATVKKSSKPSDASSIMSEYLMAKIGYIDGNRTYGMCSAVLNKCRMHTFDTNDTYQFDNTVVKEYLARTMTKIKAAQDEILNDYAGNCMVDVETCLDKNNYGTINGTYSNAAINACRSQIITCMSVNGDTTKEPNPAAIKAWIDSVYNPNSGNGGSGNGDSGNGGSGNGGSGNGGSGEGTPAEPEEPEVKCMAIDLIINSETNEQETVYKWTNSAAIYSDDECSNENQIIGKIPEKSGHTFDGYYTTNGKPCVLSTGNVVSTDESIENCNVKYWYARWIENTPTEPEATCHMYTLNDNGGTGGTGTIYKKDKDTTIYTDSNCTNSISAVNIPTKSGYTFDGYSTDNNQTCIYNTGSMSGACSDLPTDYEWTAVWNAKCVHIELTVGNYATGGTRDIYKKYNQTTLYSDNRCTTTLNNFEPPIRTDYEFTGYYDDPLYTAKQCMDAMGSYTNDITNCNPDADTKWHAKYTPKCVAITLDDKGGSGGTGTIYKKDNDTTIYSDSNCTNSIEYVEKPTQSGYTFDGYSTNDGQKCIHNTAYVSGNCKGLPTDYKWTADWAEQNECVPITLEHTNSDGTKLSGGKSATIYYKNSQLYSENTCSTKLDSYRFSGMLTSINPGSDYTYKYVEDDVSETVCITNPYAYVQDIDCQPTTETTWNVVWTPSSFTVNFVLPPDSNRIEWVDGYSPNTTATFGSTFVLPGEQRITVDGLNINETCNSFIYWCYKSVSTGTSKCFRPHETNPLYFMTADNVQDLYNSGKTMYFSFAEDSNTCQDYSEIYELQSTWQDNTYCIFSGYHDALSWCDAL